MDWLRGMPLFTVLLFALTSSGADAVVGECRLTSECQATYEGATDCKNNLGGICYCGDWECNPDSRFDAQPQTTCTDGVQNGEEDGVDCGGPCAACAPALNPPADYGSGRECWYTSECQALYVGATDCKNNLGGICYCGDWRCGSQAAPVPAPTVPIPAPVVPAQPVAGEAPVPMLDEQGWKVFNQYGWRFNPLWSDEFDRSPDQFLAPDPSKWITAHPTGWTGGGSLFDPNLAYTYNGNLVLEKRPPPSGNPSDKHHAGIVSSTALDMNHGYYEVRSQTGGAAVAWWFFNKLDNLGSYEIDVYENMPWSDWDDTRFKSNIHHFRWTRETGSVDQLADKFHDYNVLMPGGRRTTQWNTYGLLREPEGLHIYVNGVRARSIWRNEVPAASWPGDKDLPTILSTGVYKWQYNPDCNCAPKDETTFFYVDYFRVWN